MDTPLLEFKSLVKKFGDKTILDGINLSIPEGKMTAVIGKSGTGKSVMLKHVARLIEPDSGDIYYKGTSFGSLKGKKKKKLKDKFSYMFQHNALFDSYTLFDNVALPLIETTSLNPKKIEKKVLAILEQLELAEFRNNFISQLSGGMQRRVALARALVTDPEVVLFDEPTTGLDPIRRNSVFDLISKYQRKLGFTSIIVSHDIPDAFYVSDFVAILEEGKIIFSGSPLELEQQTDPLIHKLLKSHDLLIDQLSGLKDPLDFKLEIQNKLDSNQESNASFILIRLMDFSEMVKSVGEIASQHIMKTLGNSIKDIFDHPSALSSKISRSQILTYISPSGHIEDLDRKLASLKERLDNNTLFCKDEIQHRTPNFSIFYQIIPVTEMSNIGDFSFKKEKLKPLLEMNCKTNP